MSFQITLDINFPFYENKLNNDELRFFFSQLFGEEDPDQDVSPDTADPEAAGEYSKYNFYPQKCVRLLFMSFCLFDERVSNSQEQLEKVRWKQNQTKRGTSKGLQRVPGPKHANMIQKNYSQNSFMTILSIF